MVGGAAGAAIPEAVAWRCLTEALTVLAAAPDDQVAWLNLFRFETDEMAEDYGCTRAAVSRLVDAGRIDVALETRLGRIDAVLDAMSGSRQADRWACEALATDAGWLRVRRMARQALTELTGTWRHPLPVQSVSVRVHSVDGETPAR